MAQWRWVLRGISRANQTGLGIDVLACVLYCLCSTVSGSRPCRLLWAPSGLPGSFFDLDAQCFFILKRGTLSFSELELTRIALTLGSHI